VKHNVIFNLALCTVIVIVGLRDNTFVPYAHFSRVPSPMEKKNRLKVSESPPRVDALRIMRLFSASFLVNTKKIAFKLGENYMQLPPFYLPSLHSTKYARYTV
jgi:hypothetical protein